MHLRPTWSLTEGKPHGTSPNGACRLWLISSLTIRARSRAWTLMLRLASTPRWKNSGRNQSRWPSPSCCRPKQPSGISRLRSCPNVRRRPRRRPWGLSRRSPGLLRRRMSKFKRRLRNCPGPFSQEDGHRCAAVRTWLRWGRIPYDVEALRARAPEIGGAIARYM